jgi:hypothetical protein
MSEIPAAVITGTLALTTGTVGTYLVQRYVEKQRENLSSKREQLQYVFAPLEILLKMNKAEFERYFASSTSNEDREYIEIHVWYQNNTEIKRIIMEKSHLLLEIPHEFIRLLIHINVWLTEYDLIYNKRKREPPVFAAPKGFGYPTEVDNYIYSKAKDLRKELNERNESIIIKPLRKA